MVCFCQFGHRYDISQYIFLRDISVVLGNIIGPGQDYNSLRFEVDYICTKPHQHLRRRLSADTSADKAIVLKEKRIVIPPAFRNRISHEYHFRWEFYRFIKFGIPAKIGPIFLLA